ncbi:MAG: hypothetical protein A3E78_00345 [Alphaproteobacteria bacterium RIFCSPHIGHO2_12_FULL_63_12]|nr:MAG: hypothetical protein A3E78_00345 [Alphaproteobacteria bacterium RIFCSPHIGHO2_12_FULL_63_12]
MTGLVLKLKPHEKLLINGVVLQNGDKAARLRVRTAGASVLRLRDALHPTEAKTPVQKAYYIAQLVVAGAADPDVARQEVLEYLAVARRDSDYESTLAEIGLAETYALGGELFAAMRALRKIALPARSARTGDVAGEEPCFSPQSR